MELNNTQKITIDAKDIKILRELFENARCPLSTIGKKVGLSKEVVHYRIRQMRDAGLILGFNTVINVTKIGWQTYFIYVRLRNIDTENETEIIESLTSHPNVAWLIKCIGNYDLVMKMFVKNYRDLNALLKNIELEFQQHIDDYMVDNIVSEQAVPLHFLFGPSPVPHGALDRSENGEVCALSAIDVKLLKEISNNARMPLSEIASRVHRSRDVVKYHFNQLEKKRVIVKYRPSMWSGTLQLGFNWYLVILKLGKLHTALWKTLETYLLNHPHVTYFYKTIGSSDVQIELRTKTTHILNQVLMELRGILKTVLKRQELLMILHEHKYTYFPDCMLENNISTATG